MPIIRVVLLALVASQVHAHHSFQVHYDADKTSELKGVVKDFRFRSPHSTMTLEVTGADGSVTPYKIELDAVPGLRRKGIDEDTFKPGDIITVAGEPSRNPDNRLVHGRTFITQDGTMLGEKMELADTSPFGPGGSVHDRISGRWMPIMSERIVGETPLQLTAAGRSAWENFDPAQSPSNTCEPPKIPTLVSISYLYDIRIGAEAVTLTNELYGVTRVASLSGEPEQAEASGQHGLVSGRMDGEVLVVESSVYPASRYGLAIAGGPNGGGADVPSSPQKTVVERYSASGDGKTLWLEYTMADQVYLAEPFTRTLELRRVPDDTPMHPFECNVESSRVYLSKFGDATD